LGGGGGDDGGGGGVCVCGGGGGGVECMHSPLKHRLDLPDKVAVGQDDNRTDPSDDSRSKTLHDRQYVTDVMNTVGVCEVGVR
jgi:hypothetical protein